MRVATCSKYNLIDHCDFGGRQIAKNLGDHAIIAKLIFVDIWRLSKGTGNVEHRQVVADFERWVKPGIFLEINEGFCGTLEILNGFSKLFFLFEIFTLKKFQIKVWEIYGRFFIINSRNLWFYALKFYNFLKLIGSTSMTVLNW